MTEDLNFAVKSQQDVVFFTLKGCLLLVVAVVIILKRDVRPSLVEIPQEW